MTNSTTRSTLKDLVQTLKDGQEGFHKASENVMDASLKATFTKYSLQRSKFAGELESELRGLGEEDPQKEGTSVVGSLHRGWIDLKAALTKNDAHAVLAEAERGEDAAKKAYKDALEKIELPSPLRQIIASQATQIMAAHDDVKALRDSYKKS